MYYGLILKTENIEVRIPLIHNYQLEVLPICNAVFLMKIGQNFLDILT